MERPVGGVSAAVTMPLVGPVPVLLTVTVNWAPVCPCVKFPVCVLVIFRAGVGGGTTVTVSLPVDPVVLPAASASLRVQLPNVTVQVQPVPERFAMERPVGGVSAAVTVPLVGPVPVLLTVTVNWAPVWPRVKFPECVLVIFRAGVGGGTTVTVSLPFPVV